MPLQALKTSPISEPHRDCSLCPRLKEFREKQRLAHAEWFNAPVPAFGDPNAKLLIVGLAPGLQGANRTGRPFTGDYAGDLLYSTLLAYGFAEGVYEANPGDGIALRDAIIVNAVRCVPPENKPTPVEIRTCNSFLSNELQNLRSLKAIIALGRIAHDAVLMALSKKRSAFGFAHGATHDLGELRLFDSYHCSRYNTNTGVLTEEMFGKVFASVRTYLS